MTFAAWLATLPEAWRLEALERAAIREYDGGLTRAEAERLTRREWVTREAA